VVAETDKRLAREQSLWDEFHKARRYRAREELVQLYEPFARSIAARLYGAGSHPGVQFDDYLQYARVGLMEAVDRYDCGRGVAFSAFSGTRIRGAILNGLARETELAAQRKFWGVRWHDRVDSLSHAATPSEASLEEIADIAVGLAVGLILDDLDHEAEPADPNPANDPYASSELRQLSNMLRGSIADLPDKERAIVVGHYLEHLDFQAIAQQLGLSKGRVSQLHSRAIAQLRDLLERSLTPALSIKL
jgi:RNA polymerase sigma factor FliA